MRVSVIINTYNRCQELDRAIGALFYQTFSDFEVIVVNGPSSDNSEKILSKYRGKIKELSCPTVNLSMSRNIGLAAACGDIVAYMDDDAIPEPEWLGKIVAAFNPEEHGYAAAPVYDSTGVAYQTYCLVSHRNSFSRSLQSAEYPLAYPYAPEFLSCLGTNSIFSRKALVAIGGFDEQYDYFLDETDVCARLIDSGYLGVFIPNAFVIHKFAPSFLRDTRKIPLDWSKIVKNSIYFSKAYEAVAGELWVNEAITHILDCRRKTVENLYKDGAITEAEFTFANETIEQGRQDGLNDAKRGFKRLLSKASVSKYARNYLPFQVKTRGSLKCFVFFVAEYPPVQVGGIGRFIHQMATGLADLGFQIHVITPGSLQYDTVDFEENVWVHRITMKNYPDHLLKRDTAPCDLFMPRMNQLYSYYEELLNIEEKRHVDVVFTPIWDSLGFYPLFDERFKTVVSLQSCMKSVFTNPMTMPPEVEKYIQMEAFVLQKAKYIMPISDEICRQLDYYYGNVCSPKAYIVNLGLEDLSKNFIPEKREDTNIEILFLGRLEHRKGIDLLLNCIPPLCEKYENLVFRFAGNNQINIPGKSCTYEDEFFSNPENEKYRDKMIFEGVVSDERMKQLYSQCDIYVSPSRFESFGLIFLEAMMFAKPVIGCSAGGMPEVIGEHLKTGLLAAPDDCKSLQKCLEMLILSPTLRKEIGAAGRKRYEEKFTKEIMIQNTLVYFEKITEDELA